MREALEYYQQKLGFRVAAEMAAGDYAIVERDHVAVHLFQDAARPHCRERVGSEVLYMSYIPPGAKWYIAEIIEEFCIEGEPENVVHTNMVLVRADSPDQAYDLALELGRSEEMIYTNPEGKRVTVRFRGLRELYVIHDELQHGTELIYAKDIGVPEDELQKWISSKEDLSVFRKSDAADDSELL